MKQLNRVIIETFKKLNSDVEDYIKKVSDLEKEINDVKMQNKKLIKKVEALETMLDEKDHSIKTIFTQNQETERKNEELQQQLDTVLDELKRKGLLTVLTGESQVDNNESLIKLITTQKQKTDSELEELRNDLNLTKKELRRQKDQKLSMLAKQEFKFDITDIPSTSTSIKTEIENKNYTEILLFGGKRNRKSFYSFSLANQQWTTMRDMP